MSVSFILIAVLTIASAVAAMSLRQLVHCALSLSVTFLGLAALYLQLGAQFAGFAQILVYVGAVAILIVFAILLTRGGEAAEPAVFSLSGVLGVAVGLAVFALLAGAVFLTRRLPGGTAGASPEASVRDIGDALMIRYALPLEAAGVLLTAALIGAVIIAMNERRRR
jgi:NADH-quinone oxidoreductase subunit J